MTPPKPNRRELEWLKQSVNLVVVMQMHGVKVTRTIGSYKAHCPFHEDKTPSLSLNQDKGVYHCFGCGKSGDHFTFLQEHVKMDFAQALKLMQSLASEDRAPIAEAKAETVPFPYELLARVAEVWQQDFQEHSEGLNYLESRGITDRALLGQVQAGYCDGQKLLEITTEEERQHLQRVGILNERGREFFARCVVFPLHDGHGRTVGFYGRSTLPGAKIPHRASSKRGLFRMESAKGASEVILVEGVLDALALMQAGVSNVMALGGTTGLNEDLCALLRANDVRKVALALDGDEPGRKAAATIAQKLKKAFFQVRAVELASGQDPLSHPDQVAALLRGEAVVEATPASVEAATDPAPSPRRSYQKLTQAQGKMKVLVTVSNDQGDCAKSTVDLFSSRSRRQEALSLSRQLGLEMSELEQWFFEILQELQSQKEQPVSLFAKVEVEPMTPAQKTAALVFLKRPDLVDQILSDMEALGYQGENEAKLLGYCVSVSRKLEKPMSAIIQSGSGAGKSYLAEVIRKLTPPEDVVFYSRLSPQVLYHMPKDYLQHKFLVLEERVGGETCDYQIRSLQSTGILRQATVTKDPATGQLVPAENEVWGPIAYMETTTSLKLNPENTSRCFEIPLDESPEQTRRIHERQKALRSLERLESSEREEKICQLHHHAQRLLAPVAVVIPYVGKLKFPDQWLRNRRDHDRFLTLIEVLAYLHQHQRPRKVHNGSEYLEATLEDYRWAYFLAQQVLMQSLDELSRWARELHTFFLDPKQPLTRREVREKLQWPDKRTREALDELVELEFLELQRGASNLFSYALARPQDPAKPGGRKPLGLLTPDQLEKLL